MRAITQTAQHINRRRARERERHPFNLLILAIIWRLPARNYIRALLQIAFTLPPPPPTHSISICLVWVRFVVVQYTKYKNWNIVVIARRRCYCFLFIPPCWLTRLTVLFAFQQTTHLYFVGVHRVYTNSRNKCGCARILFQSSESFLISCWPDANVYMLDCAFAANKKWTERKRRREDVVTIHTFMSLFLRNPHTIDSE